MLKKGCVMMCWRSDNYGRGNLGSCKLFPENETSEDRVWTR
jgi:hypothetical protein